MAAVAPKADPYAPLAKLEAAVRYGPQKAALAQLLQQAVQTYMQGVAAAHSAARSVRSSALQAKPELAGDFRPIMGSVGSAHAMVAPDTANLSGTASGFAGAIGHDAQDTQLRLATMLAAAQNELTQRAQDAGTTEQYQTSKLGSDLQSSEQKIGQQLSDLAGQRGAFTAATLGTLHQQAAGRAVTKRGQNLSHADRQASTQAQLDKVDPSTGLTQRDLQNMTPAQRQSAIRAAKQATGTTKPAGKSGYLPNVSQHKAQGSIDSATADAKHLIQTGGYSPQDALGLLTSGRGKTSVYPETTAIPGKKGSYSIDPNTGLATDKSGKAVAGPDGKPYRASKVDLPPIKKYDSAVAQAAIDLITQGYYSPATVRALHREGIVVGNDRGSTSPAARRSQRQARQAQQALRPIAQHLGI